MTWIKTIAFAEATGRLKALYDRVVGPNGDVDNPMLAHPVRRFRCKPNLPRPYPLRRGVV